MQERRLCSGLLTLGTPVLKSFFGVIPLFLPGVGTRNGEAGHVQVRQGRWSLFPALVSHTVQVPPQVSPI